MAAFCERVENSQYLASAYDHQTHTLYCLTRNHLSTEASNVGNQPAPTPYKCVLHRFDTDTGKHRRYDMPLNNSNEKHRFALACASQKLFMAYGFSDMQFAVTFAKVLVVPECESEQVSSRAWCVSAKAMKHIAELYAIVHSFCVSLRCSQTEKLKSATVDLRLKNTSKIATRFGKRMSKQIVNARYCMILWVNIARVQRHVGFRVDRVVGCRLSACCRLCDYF